MSHVTYSEINSRKIWSCNTSSQSRLQLFISQRKDTANRKAKVMNEGKNIHGMGEWGLENIELEKMT